MCAPRNIIAAFFNYLIVKPGSIAILSTFTVKNIDIWIVKFQSLWYSLFINRRS